LLICPDDRGRVLAIANLCRAILAIANFCYPMNATEVKAIRIRKVSRSAHLALVWEYSRLAVTVTA
jgi:hypothetical protein